MFFNGGHKDLPPKILISLRYRGRSQEPTYGMMSLLIVGASCTWEACRVRRWMWEEEDTLTT